MFEYKATIRSAYDADTIRMDVDLGMSMWLQNEPMRLARIDAWEVKGPEKPHGIKARDFVRDLLPPGKEVIITTQKDKKGKFGRYIADITVDGTNLSDLLVQKGMAVYEQY